MKQAAIFNIQRFSIHDGPGIRTTVFFKGCPLSCLWCSNPESQKTGCELEVVAGNCIGCGACMKACPNGAISFSEEGVCVDRAKCRGCGRCARECYAKALKYVGETMTTEEVFEEIKKDMVFYKNSGGGVTFSGGEPLLQGEFCLEVVKRCREEGIHTAIETSGYGEPQIAEELAGQLDLIFFDIKHSDPEIHKKLTGVSNERILENLRRMQKDAKTIIVRTPIVPGYNDGEENVRRTAELCGELEKVKEWELLPYHNLGEHKYEAIGKAYGLAGEETPRAEQMERLVGIANSILAPLGKVCKVQASGLKVK